MTTTHSATITSLADIRATLADAEPVPTKASLPRGEINGQIGHGEWREGGFGDALGLPPGCKVRPLGVSGDTCYFLDPIGQVRAIAPPWGKAHVLSLFGGDADFLKWAWPRFGKGGVDSWANDDVAADLITACTARGPWEAIDKVRGRGCWRDAGGNLLVHAGTAIIQGRHAASPGEVDGYIYPTRGAIPRPWRFDEDLPANPVPLLRHLLSGWHWERPDIDPHLLLGWIGAAFLGGALDWRPNVFMTGDKGTGKSTLQRMIKALLGSWLISTTDTTAAGIYQHVGPDALPVAIDELESDADGTKLKKIVELARAASSGGMMLRGGDRHHGVEFQVRSAFLLSSINRPALAPQDLTRMALLQLKKLKPGGKPPEIDERSFGVLGRCILRRLIEQWPRYFETAAAFADELAAAGMDGRGQAQYGTLLACADLMEHDGWDPARLSHACDVEGDLVRWRDLLRPASMHEYEDATENWSNCLSHLLAVRVEAWRAGERKTVGQMLLDFHSGEFSDIGTVNSWLGQAGLKIVPKNDGGRTVYWLAIHNQGPLVRELFEGSKWAGDLGAGVWSAALRQGPTGTLWQTGTVRVNGVQARATLISLDGLYGDDGVMRDE